MKNKKSPPSQAADLRGKAEAKLKGKTTASAVAPADADAVSLVHELQVHRIELEIQNDELIRSRAELEAGLAAYSDLYDFAPMGYFTLTPDGTIIQMNLTGARLLGEKRAALMKRRFETFISDEDRPVFNAFLKKTFEGPAKETCEVELYDRADSPPPPKFSDDRLIGKPGRRTVRIEASVGEDGQTCRAVAFDITESKRAETYMRVRLGLLEFAAAHSMEEFLRKTLDEVGALTGSPVGFYHFVDADQKSLTLQAWSTRTVKEFCKADGKGLHYGLDKAGVWTECVYERRPVIHNDYASLPNRKGMPEGHSVVIRELVVPIMRMDRIVAILGVGNKPVDYNDTDVEAVSFMADVAWEISARKRAEQATRIREQAIRGSLNGIALTDPEGNITYCNPSFVKMWGFKSEEEAIGKPVGGLFAEQKEFRLAFASFRKDGHYLGELKGGRLDGTAFDAQIFVNDVKDEQGVTISYMASFVDITERKQIEETQMFLLHSGYSGRGENFFQSLARHLAQTLGMEFVCIDRLESDRLSAQTLAVLSDGRFEDNVSYTLKDTPCGQVVGKAVCCFPKGVRRLFPKDEVLQELLAESYAGTTLWDSKGQPIGLIAVIGRRPREDMRIAEMILKLVAVRAAGELERAQAEEALQRAHDDLEDRVRERTSELVKRTEQLSRLAFELTQAEINERKRLAHFLHDDLQQLLVGVKFSLSSALMNAKDPNILGSLESAKDLLNQSIAASRTLTSELSPPIIFEGGLADALEWVAHWMEEKHGLTVDLQVVERIDASYHVRVLMFQAVRELLFNIVKHAGVDRAELSIDRSGADQLVIAVSDKGKGFDSELMSLPGKTANGFGLFSVYERLLMIGGRCEIESAPGQGTLIRLFAPIA